jgi:hypothetical protein
MFLPFFLTSQDLNSTFMAFLNTYQNFFETCIKVIIFESIEKNQIFTLGASIIYSSSKMCSSHYVNSGAAVTSAKLGMVHVYPESTYLENFNIIQFLIIKKQIHFLVILWE